MLKRPPQDMRAALEQWANDHGVELA
jgi:phosphotransferase system enzyme I (PtsP)